MGQQTGTPKLILRIHERFDFVHPVRCAFVLGLCGGRHRGIEPLGKGRFLIHVLRDNIAVVVGKGVPKTIKRAFGDVPVMDCGYWHNFTIQTRGP